MKDPILQEIEEIAIAAGAAIMATYGGAAQFQEMTDASPVTHADEQAEAIILAGLLRAFRTFLLLLKRNVPLDGKRSIPCALTRPV